MDNFKEEFNNFEGYNEIERDHALWDLALFTTKERNIVQLIEEMSELTKVFTKYRLHGDLNYDNLLEEMVDVKISLDCVRIALGISENVMFRACDVKLHRAMGRLKEPEKMTHSQTFRGVLYDYADKLEDVSPELDKKRFRELFDAFERYLKRWEEDPAYAPKYVPDPDAKENKND